MSIAVLPRTRTTSPATLGFLLVLACCSNLWRLRKHGVSTLPAVEEFVAPPILELSSIWRNATSTSIAYVTFVHLKDFSRFEEYIFPARDTFLRLALSSPYHVVLTTEWKDKYYEELCVAPRDCSRIVPLFVDCPEGGFGDSPCCKQQEGIRQLLHQSNKTFDFIIYMDDDNYIRTDHLQSLLSRIDPTSPIVLTLGNGFTQRLGETSYKKVKDRAYNCSSNNANYQSAWGQPVIYTRATTELLMNANLRQICTEFQVTHDAGNAILHWMYQLPELRIPYLRDCARRKANYYGCHGVASHTELRQVAPNMHQVHERFLGLPVVHTDWQWHRPIGFSESDTYLQYGPVSTWKEWHPAQKRDCLEPHERASA